MTVELLVSTMRANSASSCLSVCHLTSQLSFYRIGLCQTLRTSLGQHGLHDIDLFSADIFAEALAAFGAAPEIRIALAV
ncbi:hypothetical protein SAMN04488032_106151 [Pacificibacter marinus]|uniref:Uncharacterized protein n=1 Tax=Pacificibacter marinus TaxID=658057 RepID=A0A1Y5S6F3_9RHOB|nr:hypothetical protein SAMN04488032_106151 [Pacificibacter marinus]SLN33575.1 hypothetical protein PAM7971_01402 [Pacificibacter marinus]